MNDQPKEAIKDYFKDQLRAGHSYPILLTSKDMAIDKQYTYGRGYMLKIYIIIALVVHAALIVMQLLAFDFSFKGTLWTIGCASMGFILFYFAICISFKSVASHLRRISQRISNNHTLAHILSFMVVSAVMLQIQIIMIEAVSLISHYEENIQRYRDDISFCPHANMNEYYLKLSLLAMMACAINQIFVSMVKPLLIFIISGIYVYVTMTVGVYYELSFIDYQSRCGLDWVEQWINVVLAFGIALALVLLSQQTSKANRLNFIWKPLASDDTDDMNLLEAYNRKMLANIYPVHVAQYFLYSNHNVNEMYHEQCDSVCVLFASIPRIPELYFKYEGTSDSFEYVRLLNEIISDFDEILAEEQFRYIEKIKSIGATYTAASGLTSLTCDLRDYRHVTAMADYALRIRNQLNYINEHSFQRFYIRIGIHIGPVIASVIGTRKPQYDIWGNTVNVASRMDSTGVIDLIRVTKEVYGILVKRGYRMRICQGNGDEKEIFYFLDSFGGINNPACYESFDNPQPSKSGVKNPRPSCCKQAGLVNQHIDDNDVEDGDCDSSTDEVSN